MAEIALGLAPMGAHSPRRETCHHIVTSQITQSWDEGSTGRGVRTITGETETTEVSSVMEKHSPGLSGMRREKQRPEWSGLGQVKSRGCGTLEETLDSGKGKFPIGNKS